MTESIHHADPETVRTEDGLLSDARAAAEWADMPGHLLLALVERITAQEDIIRRLREALSIAADAMEAQDTMLPLHQQRLIVAALNSSDAER